METSIALIVTAQFIMGFIFLAIAYYVGYKNGYRDALKDPVGTYPPPSNNPGVITLEKMSEVFEDAKKYEKEEPSGIIYRPTASELKKMHEDQVTKDAKEAMAETIRNTPEPTL